MKYSFAIKALFGIFFAALLFILILPLFFKEEINKNQAEFMDKKEINLLRPKLKSETSVEETLAKRRSVRDYKEESLSLEEISQILWSAQGITDVPSGKRTAPSAGALYPLEIYLAIRNVENIEKGVYHYIPDSHKLVLIAKGDFHKELAGAALGQDWVRNSAVNLVIGADFQRTTSRYGERGVRYVFIEVGHCSQNIYLQAVSLNLGTVAVGAFDDTKVKEILGLPQNIEPLYIMPIGKH